MLCVRCFLLLVFRECIVFRCRVGLLERMMMLFLLLMKVFRCVFF